MNRFPLAVLMTTATLLATASPAGAQPAPAAAATTAPKQYDVRDFFRNPERSRFRLAPDGKHLSFVARDSGRLNVFVQSLDANGAPVGVAKALTHESARDVSTYFWKGNAHISTPRTSVATRTFTCCRWRSTAAARAATSRRSITCGLKSSMTCTTIRSIC